MGLISVREISPMACDELKMYRTRLVRYRDETLGGDSDADGPDGSAAQRDAELVASIDSQIQFVDTMFRAKGCH